MTAHAMMRKSPNRWIRICASSNALKQRCLFQERFGSRGFVFTHAGDQVFGQYVKNVTRKVEAHA